MMAKLMVSVMQYRGLTNVSTLGLTGVNGPLASLS